MKQIVSNYTYSPTTNSVTLTGVNIDQDQLLLIVAPGVGRTLYNFASVTGSVVAGADTRVNLNASTSGLTTTSPLVIFYDDQVGAQSVTGTVALDPGSLVALENITVTVGSSVSISNFPATQTIGGTVTGNIGNAANIFGNGYQDFFGMLDDGQVNFNAIQPYASNLNATVVGTVTANAGGILADAIEVVYDSGNAGRKVAVQLYDLNGVAVGDTNNPLPIKGTVTIGSLPAISGTVTANNPSGALTTRFGSVTTANTAQITSAVTNTSRKYLLAQNISTGAVTIGIGFSPTTTQGIQLAAGGGLTFDAFCPTGAVYWLGAVTGAAFTILEG